MNVKLRWAIPAVGLLIAVVTTLMAFEETGATYDGALQQQVLYLRGIFWLLLGILWVISLSLVKKNEVN
jgi:hypothetical protein